MNKIPLPTAEVPRTKIKIPSSGKEISIRPLLVKEQKILLQAKESENASDDVIDTIVRIMENCMDNEVEVKSLPHFDIEYIFLKLMSISSDNIINVKYTDPDDGKNYPAHIDLNEIEVVFDEKHTNTIHLTDDYGIVMKYPTIEVAKKIGMENMKNNSSKMIDMMAYCIESIFSGDKVYAAKDYSNEDIIEVFEGFSKQMFEKIRDNFFVTKPKLKCVAKYKKDGEEKKVDVGENIFDFFT